MGTANRPSSKLRGAAMTNRLYDGDKLEVLRAHLPNIDRKPVGKAVTKAADPRSPKML
jgi:hypothetical protein